MPRCVVVSTNAILPLVNDILFCALLVYKALSDSVPLLLIGQMRNAVKSEALR